MGLTCQDLTGSRTPYEENLATGSGIRLWAATF